MVLTGGPKLGAVGARAGGRIHAGGARHQVVVTAAPTDLDIHDVPMVFDVTSGIYWRPGEAGGVLWGMSNPDEPPGTAVDFDDPLLPQGARPHRGDLSRRCAASDCAGRGPPPSTTPPTTCPILGPLLTDDGPVDGTVVASPADTE